MNIPPEFKKLTDRLSHDKHYLDDYTNYSEVWSNEILERCDSDYDVHIAFDKINEKHLCVYFTRETDIGKFVELGFDIVNKEFGGSYATYCMLLQDHVKLLKLYVTHILTYKLPADIAKLVGEYTNI